MYKVGDIVYAKGCGHGINCVSCCFCSATATSLDRYGVFKGRVTSVDRHRVTIMLQKEQHVHINIDAIIKKYDKFDEHKERMLSCGL